MEKICPVCGYPELDESAYNKLNHPTYTICSCCGTEFGYDDFDKNFEQLRKEWINKGAKWVFLKDKPKNWNLKDQLKNLDKL